MFLKHMQLQIWYLRLLKRIKKKKNVETIRTWYPRWGKRYQSSWSTVLKKGYDHTWSAALAVRVLEKRKVIQEESMEMEFVRKVETQRVTQSVGTHLCQGKGCSKIFLHCLGSLKTVKYTYLIFQFCCNYHITWMCCLETQLTFIMRISSMKHILLCTE